MAMHITPSIGSFCSTQNELTIETMSWKKNQSSLGNALGRKEHQAHNQMVITCNQIGVEVINCNTAASIKLLFAFLLTSHEWNNS